MPATHVKTKRWPSLEQITDMNGFFYDKPLYLKSEVNEKLIQIMTIKETVKLQAAVPYSFLLPAQPVTCHLSH
jgi:hypothetical protein